MVRIIYNIMCGCGEVCAKETRSPKSCPIALKQGGGRLCSVLRDRSCLTLISLRTRLTFCSSVCKKSRKLKLVYSSNFFFSVNGLECDTLMRDREMNLK